MENKMNVYLCLFVFNNSRNNPSSPDIDMYFPLEGSITMCMQKKAWKHFHPLKQK